MRQLRTIAAALALSLLCCACSSGEELPEQTIPKELEQFDTVYVGMILKTLNGQYYPLIKAGAEAEASRLGVDLIVVAPENENEAEEQAEIVEIMADMALDVLVISPCDESKLKDGLQIAGQNGKHILAVDQPIADSRCEGYVGPDHFQSGYQQGEHAARLAEGKRAVIIKNASEQNHEQRAKGIRLGLELNGVEVATVIDGNAEFTRAYTEVQKYLSTAHDIGVICATNDEMARGAYWAVHDSGEDIAVAAFDGTPRGLESVAEGEIALTMVQDAYEIGVHSVRAAVQLHQGKAVGADYIPAHVATRHTAQTYWDEIHQQLNNTNSIIK